MSSVVEILRLCDTLGVEVSVLDGNLKVAGDKQRLTPELIERLKANKSALVQLLSANDPEGTIRPQPHRAPALSRAQRSMWLLDELEGSASYNMPAAFLVRGHIDVEALYRSIIAIVERHEPLRTRFVQKGASVEAVIVDGCMEFRESDLRQHDARVRERLLCSLIQEEATHPFNLAEDTLLRVHLVSLDDDQQALLFTMHHIVFDDASTAIFLHEFEAYYSAFATDNTVDIADLSLRYNDFACWQSDAAGIGQFDEQLAYWEAQLKDAPRHHHLPRRNTPSAGKGEGDFVVRQLDSAIAERFEGVARSVGATPFMAYLSVYALVLMRWSQTEDIVIGVPVSGRKEPALESLIGLFVNTLPMRLNADASELFTDYLERCRETIVAGLSNQDVPFGAIVERLNPARRQGRSPLFQVMFAMAEVGLPDIRLPNATLTPIRHAYHPAPKFDLTLDLLRTENGGMEFCLEFARTFFNDAMASDLLDGVLSVVRQIAQQHEKSIGEYSLLDEHQKSLLVQLSCSASAFETPQTWFEQFARQVRERPDEIAIADDAQRISYAELDCRSSAVAAWLREQNSGNVVAMTGPRSGDFITGVIGILKAGAAYLPLSTSLPLQRRRTLLEQAEVSTVLSASRAIGTDVIAVQDLYRTQAPDSLPVPDRKSPAYCIFTSGSTGQPKGVLIDHYAFDCHTARILDELGIIAGDVIAQTADVSFDISIWQMLAPLCCGARIRVYNHESANSPDLLHEAIICDDITVLQIVPTVLQLLAMRIHSDADCGRLRFVVPTGEALSAEVARDWLAHSSVPLVNAYGPAECADDVSFYVIRELADVSGKVVPIGRPVSGVTAHVLDDWLQPVPRGVIGELFIGGTQVGMGYLAAPAQTAEHFLPDPFAGEPGARMYRTGDLVRFDESGQLLYVGRSDFQVKINGQRIELTEIEATLEAHASIRKALVTLATPRQGNAVLTAYIEANGSELPEIRSYVEERLPGSMIPSAWVLMDKWPLNANGKIDRKRLPSPENLLVQERNDNVPPTTAMQRAIAVIWEKLLKRESIGIHDNFFALGGDSILAIQVAGRLREEGIRIASRDIYRFQTIAEIAEQAEMLGVVLPADAPSTGEIPWLPIHHDYFCSEPADVDQYNQTLTVDVPGGLPEAFWHEVIRALAGKHDALRLQFSANTERASARFAEWNEIRTQAALCHEVVEPGQTLKEQVASRYEALNKRLNIAEGRLFLLGYFTAADRQTARLLLIFHHVIMDGISWRILLSDLENLLEQHRNGGPVELKRHGSSYQRWAEHLIERADSPLPDAAFWHNVDNTEVDALPVDRNTAPVHYGSTRHYQTTLGADATRALLGESVAAFGAEVDDMLLAALSLALQEEWQVSQMRVDMESHGRHCDDPAIDLSQTVGWFTAIYPVLIGYKPEQSLDELIIGTKEHRRRMATGGLSYGIGQYLSGEFDCNTPAPIEFNYLGQFDAPQARVIDIAQAEYGLFESPRNRRRHLLSINCLVRDGQLRIDVDFSAEQYNGTSIASFADRFAAAITRLAAHCKGRTRRYTPSDFPLANATQAELDDWQKQFGSIEALYPCTPMQQGMIYHSLVDQEQQTYNSVSRTALQGTLVSETFKRAWEQVIDRHEALRARFVGLDKPQFLQLIAPLDELSWRELDWRTKAEDWQIQHLADLLAEEKRHRFDGSVASLMRITLIRRAQDRYDLIWTYHHTVLDGWGMPIVLKEVLETYKAILSDTPIVDSTPPQFGTYVEWLQQQDMGAAIQCWADDLQKAELPTPLPFLGLPEARQQESGYGQITRCLPKVHLSALEGLAQQEKSTLNNLVQLAWAYLLHRYSGAEDVVFGTTVAGRPGDLPGVDRMIGLFINTLPLHVSFDHDTTLSGALHQVSAGIQKANERSFVALNQLQQRLSPGCALFDSLLVFENYPLEPQAIKSACPTSFEVTGFDVSEQSNYPLTLIATPAVEGLELQLVFQTDQLTDAQVARLADALECILEALPSRAALNDLPIYGDARLNELIGYWNNTRCDVERGVPIQALFERRVKDMPNAVAVASAAGQWTYRDIDARSNRLAHALIEYGVKPHDLVPVCLPRTVDMVVAVMAVLKAGAGFVPIDLAFPADRRRWIIDESGASHVIAEGDVAAALDSSALCVVVPAACAEYPETAPDVSHAVNGIAYIIFTSGSTGKPKGVILQHDPVVNLIHWVNDTYAVGPEDRLLFITSLSFDLSIYDIFGTLAAGASLYLADEGQIQDPQCLVELIENEGITFWDSAPAALMRLAPLMPERSQSRLRLVFLSGDWVPLSLPPQLQSIYPQVQVVALGGATEAAIWSNHYNVGALNPYWRSVPYGLPIQNAHYHILDSRLRPCDIGVAGDLYIGGDCLSFGYFNRPALTAERYLPDPFTDKDGGMLYLTGDRARRMPDGNIEFLGRSDNQVKLRGYRVELGEIESVLKHQAGIREAVAIVRQLASGAQRLLAYVQPGSTDTTIDTPTLMVALRNSVPDYMVPSAIIELTSWPVTPNGKLDRNALPDPDDTGNDHPGSEPPRPGVETTLANIWRQVLSIESIGRHDNFFERGGDSIISIQLVTRARRTGLIVSPQDVFRHPTIAALAEVVEQSTETQAPQAAVVGDAPVTPAQHWLLSQQRKHPSQFNQALLLKLRRVVDAQELASTLDRLCQHHDALRMRLVGDRVTRLVEPGANNAIVLTAKVENEDTNAHIDRLHQCFDVAHGPIFGALLLQKGERQELLLAAHHLAVDGVSWRFILEDLERLLLGIETGEGTAPDSKTAPWTEWSHALLALADNDSILDQVPFWQEQLSTPALEFASETPAAPVARDRIIIRRRLDVAKTQALLGAARSMTNASPEEMLIANLARAMLRSQAASTLRLEMEGHGRLEHPDLPDVTRTVGWFTAIYPVALKLADAESLGQSLTDTKETLRRVPDEGVGFGLLQQRNAGDAAWQSPLSRVTFNYLGQFDNAVNHSQVFALSDGDVGAVFADDDAFPYTLEVTAMVRRGQLEIEWAFCPQRVQAAEVDSWADKMIDGLLETIEFSQQETKPLRSATDFPLARISQTRLAQLQDRYPCIDDIYPLTPMQQGLMYHTVVSGENAYVAQYLFELEGNLNVEAFKAAWFSVAKRHDMLRARFPGLSDSPVQVILGDATPGWQTLDWRTQSAPARQRSLREWQGDEEAKGFNLETEAPLRMTLIRTGDDRYLFNVSFHHIILDGWSLAALNREVAIAYRALRDGSAPRLDPVQPMRRYVEWRGQCSRDRAMIHWRSLFGDLREPCKLPECHQAGDSRTDGAFALQLDASVTTDLNTLANNWQLTLNTLIQGAWALVLSRFSGKTDVTFGVTVSGRPVELEGVEQMVGLFINTLPMRVDTACETSLIEWLRAIQGQQLASSEFQHTPLVEIQKCTELAPGQAMFDSYVVFENFPDDPDFIRETTQLSIDGHSARFRGSYPLAVQVNPGVRLELKGIYEPALLAPEVVRDAIEWLAWMLGRLAKADLDAPVKQSVLATPPTLRPASAPVLKNGSNWIEQFEAVAATSPDTVVVTCGDESYTYATLNARANQLARQLISLGVNMDDRVGLLVSRGVQTVLGLLAVNKAGAAYVPLEPATPAERLDYIRRDTGMTCALVDAEHSLDEVTAIFVDDPQASWHEQPDGNLDLAVPNEALAYVIYTSGSTGTPKGVLVEHAQLGHYLAAITQRLELAPGLSYAHMLPFNVDSGNTVLFPAITTGGTLHIAPERDLLNPVALAQFMVSQEVDCLKIAPSYLKALLTDATSDDLLPRQRLVLGGEVSHWDQFTTLQQRKPDRVFNHYGPSETTVGVLTFEGSLSDAACPTVPLGRPLAPVAVRVLDEQLRPVPDAVAGQLFIGGRAVTRGYLGQPGMTAERFHPDPWSDEPGARMYATGDVVRRLPNGLLEFLGRADHQVKIRGHRVELQEIEARLLQQKGVEAAIVHVKSLNGSDELVGYVVGAADVGRLRDSLASQLPEYMVPRHIVALDALPLTAQGKIDRKALPGPTTVVSADTENIDFPIAVSLGTGIGAELCQICAEALDAPVQPEDNFFALGGDSIKAIMAVAMANERGIELQPQMLFEHLTIASLAAHLETQRFTRKLEDLAAIWREVLERDDIDEHSNFFALGGDSIRAIMAVAKAEQTGYRFMPQALFECQTLGELVQQVDMPATSDATDVGGSVALLPSQLRFFQTPRVYRNTFVLTIHLESSETLVAGALQEAGQRLVEAHPALRSRFVQSGNSWQSEIIDASDAHYWFATESTTQRPSQDQLAELAWRMADEFDLATGPLFGMALVQWSGGSSVLLQAHHLIVDGVSWHTLAEDLNQLLRGNSVSGNQGLKRLAVHYQEAAGELDAGSEARRVFEKHIAESDARLGEFDDGGTYGDELEVTCKLPADVTAAVLGKANDTYKTEPQMLLLSALSEALNRRLGKSKVRFTLEHHSREETVSGADIARMVGWMTRAYPVVLEVIAGDAGATIRQVKETLRAIPDNGREYPLWRYMRPDDTPHWLASRSDVLFHFMGSLNSDKRSSTPLRLAEQQIALPEAVDERRPFPLVVVAAVESDELNVRWQFSSRQFDETTMRQLAGDFEAALKTMLEHCGQAEQWATPSDFRHVNMDQRKLDKLMKRYKKK